jgi:hypothetical protein
MSVQFSISKILIIFQHFVQYHSGEFFSIFFFHCSDMSIGFFQGPFLLLIIAPFFVLPVPIAGVLLLARAIVCEVSRLFAVEASSFL